MSPSPLNRKRQLSSPVPVGACNSKALSRDSACDGLAHCAVGNSSQTGASIATGIAHISLEASAELLSTTSSSIGERPLPFAANGCPVELAVEHETDLPSDVSPFCSLRPQSAQIPIDQDLDQTFDGSSLNPIDVDQVVSEDDTPDGSFSNPVVLQDDKIDGEDALVTSARILDSFLSLSLELESENENSDRSLIDSPPLGSPLVPHDLSEDDDTDLDIIDGHLEASTRGANSLESAEMRALNANEVMPAFNSASERKLVRFFAKRANSRIFDRTDYNYACAILQESGDGYVDTPLRYQSDRRKRHAFRSRIIKLHALIDGELHHKTNKGTVLVATVWNCFEYICKAHIDGQHCGARKTSKISHKEIHRVTQEEVAEVLKHCNKCKLKKALENVPELRPIVSNRTLERVQVDLISLLNEASAGYKFILHLKDHYSKFSMLWALKQKTALEVTVCMQQFILWCGPPEIVQCDNGTEFKGAFLILLKEHGIKLINGRPRHPQTQGLVEQGNATVKARLIAWKDQTRRTDWHKGLPYIYNAMNRTSCRGLPRSITPAEVFFAAVASHLVSRSYPEARFEEEHDAVRSMTPEEISTACERATGLDYQRVSQALDAHQSRASSEDELCTYDTDPQPDGLLDLIDAHQIGVRESMVRSHRSRNPLIRLNVGDFCTVSLPPNLIWTTYRRFAGRVVAISSHNRDLYKIQSKFGVLNTMIGVSDINLVDDESSHLWKHYLSDAPTASVTMNRVASNSSTAQYRMLSCRCEPDCRPGRCPCIRANRKCSHACAHETCANEPSRLASREPHQVLVE